MTLADHAELWWKEQGNIVPPKNTKEWKDMYKKWIEYAYKSWVSQFNKSGEYFNLNLHDWLIGTKNRLDLLDKILKYMKSKNAEFVLARDL